MESTGVMPASARLRLAAVDGITQGVGQLVREVCDERELSAAQCLKRAMARSTSKADLTTVRQGWPNLDAFVKRLGALLTDQVPTADPVATALQEALEAACLHFLSAGPSAPAILGPARFLAAGVSSATRSLLTYTIEGLTEDGAPVVWCIHHGPMQEYLRKVKPLTLRFTPRVALPGERHAMKTWVMNQVLHFEDQVLLSRAGVDARTFEPY